MKNLKIFSVLTIIIATFTFTACSGESSPSDTVKKYHELIKSKNYQAASKLFVNANGEKLSEDEIKKIEGLLGMAQEDNEKKGGITNLTINEEKIEDDGNLARVNCTIEYGNGKTKTERIKLHKIDGKWFINVQF